MNKCHYVYDKDAGRVLIPMCWEVVNSNDMSLCSCRKVKSTVYDFSKKRFNDILIEKDKYINELEKELFNTIRILRKVNGFKLKKCSKSK